jgi:hypothetical protein
MQTMQCLFSMASFDHAHKTFEISMCSSIFEARKFGVMFLRLGTILLDLVFSVVFCD